MLYENEDGQVRLTTIQGLCILFSRCARYRSWQVNIQLTIVQFLPVWQRSTRMALCGTTSLRHTRPTRGTRSRNRVDLCTRGREPHSLGPLQYHGVRFPTRICRLCLLTMTGPTLLYFTSGLCFEPQKGHMECTRLLSPVTRTCGPHTPLWSAPSLPIQPIWLRLIQI